jgi:hypothetical protein
MSRCEHLSEMLEAQTAALREAISEDKWYLSERAGYDIGFEKAQADFLEKYVMAWGAGFRKAYCGYGCKYRDICTARLK